MIDTARPGRRRSKKSARRSEQTFCADEAAIFDPSPWMRPGHLGEYRANHSESGLAVRGERAAIVRSFMFSKN